MGHSHGIRWTEELMINDINRVIQFLGLNRFPTQHEINDFYGNSSLSQKISKTGGTKHWADKMGFDVKYCDSEFGESFEKYAINDIRIHTGLDSYKTKTRYPYDIATNKHIKVDIKSSTIVKSNNGFLYHSFKLEKREPTCDIYILYCINDNDKVYKTLIIPSCHVYGQTQISTTISGNSKWDRYEDNWNLFASYDRFYSDLMKQKVG